MLEIAFGYGVAKGAKSIYPPEGRETATLKAEALRITPGHPILAIWPVKGLGPDIPPRIDLDYLHEYGKRLGYDDKVDDITLMFENIGSLQFQSSDIKWNLLPDITRPSSLDTRTAEHYETTIPTYRRRHFRLRSLNRTDITKDVLRGLIEEKLSMAEMAEKLSAS